MSKERQVGASIGGSQPEFLSKDPANSPSPRRIERIFDEDNHSKGKFERAVHDMHKSSVSDLLRMATLQKIESEMENKHKCELLYHMTRQKLEMCQLRQELGTLSGMKETTPISISTRESHGLANQSSHIKPTRINRGNMGERASSWGRDDAFDSNIDDSVNSELEALRIAGKIPDLPGSPELGPTKAPWGDDVERGQYPASYKGKEFVRDVLQLYDLYDSGRTRDNFIRGFVGKSVKSHTSSFHEENARSKFNAELFKTEICRSWSEFGICPYGHNCRYAHGLAELRVKPKPHWKYKTERCKKFLNGYCPYGSRCCFVHKLNEFQKPVGRDVRGDPHSDQKAFIPRRWHGHANPMHPSKLHLQMSRAHE